MPSDRGAFITLEGVDGSGKSTQAAMLVCRLRESGLEVVSLREPGGTSISEKIRGLLLDPANAEMSDECELLLYEASRAQLVREVVEPALERGAVVVCDRFLGLHACLPAWCARPARRAREACERAWQLRRHARCHARARHGPCERLLARNGRRQDRLEAEGLAFQQRVRADYLACAKADPARIRVIDAAGEPADVARRIDGALATAGVLEGVSHHA